MSNAPLRVAIVGSGSWGMAVAHALQGLVEVTLFKAGDYFGGRTHTVDITLPTHSLGRWLGAPAEATRPAVSAIDCHRIRRRISLGSRVTRGEKAREAVSGDFDFSPAGFR